MSFREYSAKVWKVKDFGLGNRQLYQVLCGYEDRLRILDFRQCLRGITSFLQVLSRARVWSVLIIASFSGLVFCAVCASETGSVKVERGTAWPGTLGAHIYEMLDE